MTRQLGSYNTATTRTHVRFQFSTHAAAGANVAPLSAFENSDLRIYKAADSAAYSATQRSSSAGITMTSPFDSLTGVHDVDIDLTDNTDAGFYAAGSRYSVVLAPDETIDSQTITGIVLAEFEIGPPPVNVTQVAGVAAAASTITEATIADEVQTRTIAGVTVANSLGAQAKLDVNAEADTALNDYDGPTNAELATALGSVALSNAGIDALFTRQLTESYAADGAAPTVAQALMLIQQAMTEGAISGVTWTVKKLDGTTTAATITLNDATTPTSKTRAT